MKELEKEVNDLVEVIIESMVKLRKLKSENSELSMGYSVSPGGVLNAYREGDLSFKEAESLLVLK